MAWNWFGEFLLSFTQIGLFFRDFLPQKVWIHGNWRNSTNQPIFRQVELHAQLGTVLELMEDLQTGFFSMKLPVGFLDFWKFKSWKSLNSSWWSIRWHPDPVKVNIRFVSLFTQLWSELWGDQVFFCTSYSKKLRCIRFRKRLELVVVPNFDWEISCLFLIRFSSIHPLGGLYDCFCIQCAATRSLPTTCQLLLDLLFGWLFTVLPW